MLKTTTENIEGKKIENYLGVVSGTDIYLAGGVLGGGMANQEKLRQGSKYSNVAFGVKSNTIGSGCNSGNLC